VELEGMEATLRFTKVLDDMELPGTSIVDDVARLFEGMAETEFSRVSELGKAWVSDATRVLG
jgi:hypothetical protein